MSLTPLVEAPLQRMGVKNPTLIQQMALPVALQGSDLIGIAPTGSGKTLVYALAIADRLQKDSTSRALVLTPTRETADQIFGVFTNLFKESSVSTCLVVAGMPDRKLVSQLNKLPRLIVATPGRLMDHLSGNKLLLQKLGLLVIDEADRMLDKGFGPQLLSIRSTLRGDFQTLMFAASFSPAAEKFAQGFFPSDCYLIQARGSNKPIEELKQIVMFLDQGQKNDRLVEILKSLKGSCIVFAKDQPSSEDLGEHLAQNGLSVDVIHGDFKYGHRDRVIRDFRSGKFQILVTTDLLARGLDVPDIELVVNFDLPKESEDFLHRIGRTARAGKSGTAITFISRSDEAYYKKLKPYLKNAEEINQRNGR